MKRLCSGGAPRNGSRGIFASLFEPFLDMAFLIQEHLNPTHDLAVNLWVAKTLQKKPSNKSSFIAFCQLETPLSPRGRGLG
jgi:hypothetical protein